MSARFTIARLGAQGDGIANADGGEVFIAFTLSQAGLVRHWLRERTAGWRFSAGINAIGAVVTGVVTVVVAVTKFLPAQ